MRRGADQRRGTSQRAARRRALALTSLLVAGGSLVAHQSAYVVAYGDDAAPTLARTGHGYLGQAPLVLAIALALAVVALVADGAAARGRLGRAAPAWPFALAAPVAFAIQEHVERLLATGEIPWHAALEPSFAIGLLLQIPFALAAWRLARVVARLAVGLGERLALPRPARTRAPRALRRPGVVDLVPRSPLAARHAGRAPPAA